MARKNLLDGLTDLNSDHGPATTYPMRGAGKSLVRSLDELARQADKYLEGEVVLEIDPDLVDDSFVQDRLVTENDDFRELVEAIRLRGQDTPILVRPHLSEAGRYQVVFGHRRLRAARELGRKVRAVVKAIDDKTHVIAQGQENSARANLTFIERALFAKRLSDLGYDRDVVTVALASNAAAVSKMLSVTERIPQALIAAIGDAPSVGRERWVELSLLVGKAGNAHKVDAVLADTSLDQMTSDERFLLFYAALNKSSRPVKKQDQIASATTWHTTGRDVVADLKKTGRGYSISLKAKNATRFGDYLARNLDVIYQQFLDELKEKG